MFTGDCMRMKRNIVAVLIFCFMISASVSSAEEMRVAIGHALFKRVFEPVRQPFKEKTGLDLHIELIDPLPAITLLEKGMIELAGAGVTLENWLDLAEKAGIPVKEKEKYASFVVLTESTRFIVNAANKVPPLSKNQLKSIFTGKITNWKEVGGDDMQILVVWPTLTSGAFITVKQRIMDNEQLVKTIYDVETIRDVPDAIISAPETIGIITGEMNFKGLKEIATPIERPLSLIYKGTASNHVQKLLDFLKGEGKQYLQ